ncbi:ABC transporter ATP-binding protein [Clostridium sp. WILCCON 0269]|uniref:ABC transporter ATP-binding protein n=1 Tax=Candidatus Clostridium eludens TaxID=3381663 RepID=A0ABW8SH92_9CLOT
MTVLKVNNLMKEYRGKTIATKAIDDINLTVEENEFVGIMGASGSGKTTLLNMLSGIDKPTSGSIEISGEEIYKMNKDKLALFRRKHIGFVFQDFNLIDSLSVKDNIMLPLVLDEVEEYEIYKKVNELSKAFDIEKTLDKYPYEISGGQQQRAAICRAIANSPSIIFADEPTGNLDSKSSKKVMTSFEKLNEVNKATIVMVTHDSFAASYCSRVVFIRDGKIDGEIRKNGSRHEFADEILSCVSAIGGQEDGL